MANHGGEDLSDPGCAQQGSCKNNEVLSPSLVYQEWRVIL
jgi:hypothetical protein